MLERFSSIARWNTNPEDPTVAINQLRLFAMVSVIVAPVYTSMIGAAVLVASAAMVTI